MERIEEEENFGYAMRLAYGMGLPMTLDAAIKLRVFEIIDKAGAGAKLSASKIASQMAAQNPDASAMLDRLLVFLASHRVLTCSVVGSQRLYGLAPVAKYFIPGEDGVSLCSFIEMSMDKSSFSSWSSLKDAVLEGGSAFQKGTGMAAYEYLSKESKLSQLFNSAMFSLTSMVMKKILESYDGFKNFESLVDIGGGTGINLRLITSKYPHIRGINFDLPLVLQDAPPYPGVEHIGGDMLQSVPKGDAIFMKSILHNWSDEHCIVLLKNCYNAIPNDGRVIAVEVVVPVKPEANDTQRCIFLDDMLMMIYFSGGKERTREEFLALAKAAGFKGIRFICSACTFWVMEFYK